MLEVIRNIVGLLVLGLIPAILLLGVLASLPAAFLLIAGLIPEPVYARIAARHNRHPDA
jgi:hypothetical protein